MRDAEGYTLASQDVVRLASSKTRRGSFLPNKYININSRLLR